MVCGRSHRHEVCILVDKVRCHHQSRDAIWCKVLAIIWIKASRIQWSLSIMDPIGTIKTVLYMEVSLIQRLSNTVKYYCGTRTSVLNREMSFIQSGLNREVSFIQSGLNREVSFFGDCSMKCEEINIIFHKLVMCIFGKVFLLRKNLLKLRYFRKALLTNFCCNWPGFLLVEFSCLFRFFRTVCTKLGVDMPLFCFLPFLIPQAVGNGHCPGRARSLDQWSASLSTGLRALLRRPKSASCSSSS